MYYYGFLSGDKKLGSADEQKREIREALGFEPEGFIEHREDILELLCRPETCIVITHARAFGFHKGGFARREEMLDALAAGGAVVKVLDGDEILYDNPEVKAAFHELALARTGKPSPKQKKNPGRPADYVEPQGEQREQALGWYAGKLHYLDVGFLIGEMMGTKPVSRAKLHEWFGARPKYRGKDAKDRRNREPLIAKRKKS